MFQDNNVGPGFHLQPHGYMNDNQNQHQGGGGGGNMYGQQNRRYMGGNDQPKKPKVFTPVTLKMVHLSQPRPDDQCEYDGDTINDIIIVGRLLKRIEEPMRTQFEINDNTQTFHVLFYHKGENQVPTALRNFNYEQFSYAKIYGNIRVFKEEKAIVGTHIKRIDKFDEVTNHFLSVFISNCIRKKGILKPKELAIDQGHANIPGVEMMQVDQQQQQQQQQQQNQYNNNNGYQGGGYNRGGYNNYNNNNNGYNNNYKNNYNNRGNYKNNYNNNYNNNNNNNNGMNNNQNYQGGQNNQQENYHNNQNYNQNNNMNNNNNNGNQNNFNDNNNNSSNNHQMLNDDDLKNMLLNNIKEVLQHNKFVQRDQLRQMMSNYCKDDRLDKALNKLMHDGNITQAQDNNTFCLV